MGTAGQRTRFKAFVVIGDNDGHIGLGVKCSKEVATAIRGAIILAKTAVIPVRRGYWGSTLGNPHTVPCKVTASAVPSWCVSSLPPVVRALSAPLSPRSFSPSLVSRIATRALAARHPPSVTLLRLRLLPSSAPTPSLPPTCGPRRLTRPTLTLPTLPSSPRSSVKCLFSESTSFLFVAHVLIFPVICFFRERSKNKSKLVIWHPKKKKKKNFIWPPKKKKKKKKKS